MKKEDLKELNAVIQACDCGKIDAYKDDGHDCEALRLAIEQREATEENN